ncbi:MAG: hypothetical protein J6T81_06145 [Bacteroidales bacterium]|nr:hypothetical protein [Bacteroidales bacterium]
MEDIIKFLKKNWYYVAAVVVLIVVILIIRRRRKNNAAAEAALFYGTGNTADSMGLTDAKYPLRPYDMVGVYSADKGSMGAQIRYLQKLINDSGAYNEKLDEDGKYGAKTLAAFKYVWANSISGNGTITEAQYDEIIKKSYNK